MKQHKKVAQSRVFFNRAAMSYDASKKYQKVKLTFDSFLRAIQERDVCSVLDVGCGTGEFLRILSENLPEARLWGVDISEKMLEVAKEKLGDSAELILGDSEHIPLASGSCDVICCNHSFHHYPHPRRVLKEFHRVLKPDGVLLIGENRLPFYERMKTNVRLLLRGKTGDIWIYSEQEMRFLLSLHFTRVNYEKIEDRYCFIAAYK